MKQGSLMKFEHETAITVLHHWIWVGERFLGTSKFKKKRQLPEQSSPRLGKTWGPKGSPCTMNFCKKPPIYAHPPFCWGAAKRRRASACDCWISKPQKLWPPINIQQVRRVKIFKVFLSVLTSYWMKFWISVCFLVETNDGQCIVCCMSKECPFENITFLRPVIT